MLGWEGVGAGVGEMGLGAGVCWCGGTAYEGVTDGRGNWGLEFGN